MALKFLNNGYFAGKVGIGTTSPDYLLDLYKSTSTTETTLQRLWNYVGSDLNQQKTFIDFVFQDDNDNEYPQVRIGAEVGQNGNASSQIKEGSGAFVVYTNNATGDGPGAPTDLAERFRVDYKGNVGIGTANPGAKLQLGDYPSNNIDITTYPNVPSEHMIHITAPETTNRYGGGISFGENAFTAANITVQDAGGNGSLHMLFGTRNTSGTVVERMRVTSGGDVGIGTTSPDGKLDVAQNMTAGTTTAFTSPHLSLTALNATDNTGFVGMTFATSDNVNYGWSWGALRTNGGLGDMVLRNHYNSAQGTEKMRILANGNVGIGVTSPTTHLEVVASQSNSSIRAGGLEMQSYAVNNSWYAENLYYDGGWKLRSNGYATQMYMQDSKITFNRFVSGNAGDFVTPYPTMVLASNGKVGISTTNPSAQLQVTSTGSNGSGGYSQYGILTTAGGSNQATIGAMHDGDGSANLNLGSNVSSSNVFWHISKRVSTSTDFGGNNGLDYFYYNGSGFTNVFGFSTAGNFKAAGSIQMADDTDTASATKVGTMRYRTGTEYVEVTGTELVTNGDFASSTSWELRNSASINNGTGVATVPGAGALGSTNGNWSLSQASVFAPSTLYKVRFQARRSAGTASEMYVGQSYSLKFNQVLTADWVQYEVVFTSTSNVGWSDLSFGGVVGTTSEVKEVSVVEVTAEDASYADMCMQTGASTYEWVNIVRNTY
jgi:hypothetical protein